MGTPTPKKKKPAADLLRAITVRVSRAEYAELEAARGELHMTQYCRKALRSYARGER